MAENISQNVKLGMLPVHQTAIFLCDLQEKFQPAMLHFNQIVENAKKLVDTSRTLGIPLVVTEQYPKGLGPTVGSLDIKHAVGVFPKTKFSMVIPEVEKVLDEICLGNLKCAILFGVEAHVCVEQTAIDLMQKGITVHVVADASTSRTQEDRLLAFERLKQIGCFIATSENVIYKLLGDKEHPKFNDIRPLIKEKTAESGLVSKMYDQGLIISNGFMVLSRKSKLELACAVLTEIREKLVDKLISELVKMEQHREDEESKEAKTNKPISPEIFLKNSCTVCDKSFKRPQELKRHLKIHEEQKSYLCETCGSSFRTKDGLEYHVVVTHPTDSMKQQQIKCPECSKHFHSLQQLKIHSKNSHYRAKSDLSCPTCQKTFQRTDVLRSHMKLHDPIHQRPFVCEICSKSFASKSNLQSHQRTHGLLSDLRCQTCLKKFNSAVKLKCHIEDCVNRKCCPSCKFSCKTEDDFMEHMRKSHPADYAIQTVFGNTLEDA